MKKLVSLGLILINGLILGQSTDFSNYEINANVGLTIPVQGSNLRKTWHNGPYFSLDFIRKSKVVDFKIGIDYEYLHLSNDKIKFITPHIGIVHSFNNGNFYFIPSICIGYSWINYTIGKGLVTSPVPAPPYQEYKQDAFSASFDLKVLYAISDRFQIGVGVGYLNIFESFGPEIQKPDDSKFIGLLRPNVSVLFKI